MSVPEAIPVTTPDPVIVAKEGLAIFHTPPVVASVNVTEAPMQTEVAPVMGAALGNGFTTSVCNALAVPHMVVTE